MNNFGQLTMQLGLIAICISSVCYMVLSYKKDNVTLKNMARYSFIGFSALITIASMLLMRSILNHEFIYSYVAAYSSRDLPLLYLISSFWAGQEGSFLLWVLACFSVVNTKMEKGGSKFFMRLLPTQFDLLVHGLSLAGAGGQGVSFRFWLRGSHRPCQSACAPGSHSQ